MMTSGVYTIETPTGRQYVGSAVNFAARFRVHRHHLRAGTHPNAILQAAWNKYGEALVFSPILFCSREQVVLYEQIAIDALNPVMNVLKVAGNSYGYRHTQATKSKFHLRKKATPHRAPRSQATRDAISAAKKGKKYGPYSPERCAAQGAGRVGIKLTPEAIAKRTASRARNRIARVSNAPGLSQ